MRVSAIAAAARAKKLPYDHIRDFAFVSMVGTTPNVIVTHPQMAMKNLKDVIAYATKNPGRLHYGFLGRGASPNLSVEPMKLEGGVDASTSGLPPKPQRRQDCPACGDRIARVCGMPAPM